MKTPEDEAFDELARKQGAWGGGFKAKQAMAADKMQEPAQKPVAWAVVGDGKFGKYEIGRETVTDIDSANYWISRGYKIVSIYTAPPQREWIWLSDADIAEVIDTTCQYSGSYEEFLIKKAERKIRNMNT